MEERAGYPCSKNLDEKSNFRVSHHYFCEFSVKAFTITLYCRKGHIFDISLSCSTYLYYSKRDSQKSVIASGHPGRPLIFQSLKIRSSDTKNFKF